MLRRSFFASLLVVFMVMIQGCMPVTKPFVPAKVQADKALVYVYRPDAFLQRGVIWSLMVNDKQASTYFVNNGYIPLYVSPGDVKISLTENALLITTNNLYDSLTLKNVKKGDIYYIKAVAGPFSVNKLELMDSKVGAKEIKDTSYYVDESKKK